eukprot:gb/GECG01008432.1/.p1 GENE.gb/GECG01008432.1/~~gb/GECG01008432.1/.p1  ORF type:complete len:138 (+),score=6.46 gb/GECG01008432.1/:1-414(+)
MVKCYLSNPALTFLLCSTYMKVWDPLKSGTSRVDHSELTKFVSLHSFEIDHLISILRKYLLLGDTFFADEEVQWYLPMLRRPLVLEYLIHNMFSGLILQEGSKDFVVGPRQSCVNSIEEHMGICETGSCNLKDGVTH